MHEQSLLNGTLTKKDAVAPDGRSTGNYFLDGLSTHVLETILHAATPVDLPQRTVLFTADRLPNHLYFPTEGLASVVVTVSEGGSVEVFMTGKDGLVGASFLMAPRCSAAHCLMQTPGRGLRVPFGLMQQLAAESAEFRERVQWFVHMTLNISMQATACGLMHEATARLARWLLMAGDRTDSDAMVLTQEFLAEMMGTQRTTVALVAGTLRNAGLIDYSRGKITIKDRDGLTDAACECYGVMRKCNDEFLGRTSF